MINLFKNIIHYLKDLIRKIFKLFDNIWLKRISTLLVALYAIYTIYKQYVELRTAIANISLRLPILVFSCLVLLCTFLLSILSWGWVISSFGYFLNWVNIAHTQMMSSIGKYIPGRIWNYSSKVFLSHKLGLSIKDSSLAFFTDISISYLLAFCLSLIFIPIETFPSISMNLWLFIRISGVIIFVIVLISPFFIGKNKDLKKYFKNSKFLFLALMTRTAIWFISAFGFKLLSKSLGYPEIIFINSIGIVTSSFFIGFLFFLIPDGIFVREATIVFLSKHLLDANQATVLSMTYRLQLVVLEFIAILGVYIVWNITDIKRDS